jgi:omega-6 fatty acid desaturase (delta-12 desaturase)
MGENEWSMAKGQLASTVHVDYPNWVEWIGHDINWHVPHHVCVGIPHYHLRKAHAALKQHYPEVVIEERFGIKLVSEVLQNCHFIRSKKPADTTWVRKDEGRGLAAAPAKL